MVLDGFKSAVQFLTILPMGRVHSFEPKKMIPFFPGVGILLGIMLATCDWIIHFGFSNEIRTVVDVVFLIVITGGLHFDGLGDTADGLLGHHTREKAMTIMKDSRMGAMGILAMISAFTLKIAGIYSLPESQRWLILIIVPALSRGGLLFGIKYLKYGRSRGGKGHDFFNSPLAFKQFWGLIIPISLLACLGFSGLFLLVTFIITTFIILAFFHFRMNCITGDMLGAMVETLETFLFLVVTVQVSL